MCQKNLHFVYKSLCTWRLKAAQTPIKQVKEIKNDKLALLLL